MLFYEHRFSAWGLENGEELKKSTFTLKQSNLLFFFKPSRLLAVIVCYMEDCDVTFGKVNL